MKHVFRFTGTEANDILARHVLKQQGLENELCSWRCSLTVRHDEFEVTLERVPVQLRNVVPSDTDGRGEDEKGSE